MLSTKKRIIGAFCNHYNRKISNNSARKFFWLQIYKLILSRNNAHETYSL